MKVGSNKTSEQHTVMSHEDMADPYCARPELPGFSAHQKNSTVDSEKTKGVGVCITVSGRSCCKRKCLRHLSDLCLLNLEYLALKC